MLLVHVHLTADFDWIELPLPFKLRCDLLSEHIRFFFCFSTLDRGPLWALLSTSTATCACQARVLLPYDFFVALFFYLTFSRLQIVLCWALLHCYGRECYWVLGGELICCFCCCCFFTTLHFIKRGEHTLAASRRVSTCSVEVEKFNSELNSVAWRSRVDGFEVSV